MVLFFASACVACTNSKPKNPQTVVFVEEKLVAFIAQHPEWEENEAAITDKFKHKVINWSNEANFLTNMPLQLQSIVDTTAGAQVVKMAHFTTFLDKNRAPESLLNHMQLHIKGIISNAQATQLQIGKPYILNGTLHKQGKRADVKLVKLANGNTYVLGSYTFLIRGFKTSK